MSNKRNPAKTKVICLDKMKDKEVDWATLKSKNRIDGCPLPMVGHVSFSVYYPSPSCQPMNSPFASRDRMERHGPPTNTTVLQQQCTDHVLLCKYAADLASKIFSFVDLTISSQP